MNLTRLLDLFLYVATEAKITQLLRLYLYVAVNLYAVALFARCWTRNKQMTGALYLAVSSSLAALCSGIDFCLKSELYVHSIWISPLVARALMCTMTLSEYL